MPLGLNIAHELGDEGGAGVGGRGVQELAVFQCAIGVQNVATILEGQLLVRSGSRMGGNGGADGLEVEKVEGVVELG